jgi:hypothetical protein
MSAGKLFWIRSWMDSGVTSGFVSGIGGGSVQAAIR